ncbi:MAG: hypothetical protein IIC81_06900, partial [Chloroflexi bacterium]|nr:hypothetical protein [Chloroflexota bacterium]
ICLSVRVHIGDETGLDPEMLPLISRLANPNQVSGIDVEEVAIIGDPGRCAERITRYQKAGVSHFLLDFQYHGLASVDYSMRQMDRFVEQVFPLL